MRVTYCIMAMGLIGACDTQQSVHTATLSTTLNVLGDTEDSEETFSGTVRGDADSSRTLWITSDKGLSCIGRFVDVTQKTGSGTFDCSNDQSGWFEFVSTGKRRTGTATIGKRHVTFRFG